MKTVAAPTDVIPRYQSMSEWKTKATNKLKVASRTPGSKKKDNCQATTMEKFFAKRGRSYKHRDYAAWSLAHRVR